MRISLGAIFTIAAVAGVAVMLWTLATVEPEGPDGLAPRPPSPEQLRERLAKESRRLERRPDDIRQWLTIASLLNRLNDDPAERIDSWLAERAPDRLVEDAAAEGMIWYAMSWAFSEGGRNYDAKRARAARAKAIDLLERFAQSRPGDATYWHWNTLGYAHLRQGAPEKTPTYLKRAGERLRAVEDSLDEKTLDRGVDRLAVAWRLTGDALKEQGDRDAAVAAWARAGELIRERGAVGRNLHWHMLGWRFKDAGADERARDAWERWTEKQRERARRRENDGRAWYDLACGRALLGKTEGALEAWRRAVDAGYNNAEHALEDRDLASIHEEAAFQAGIERIRKRLDENRERGAPQPMRIDRDR